MGDKRRSDAAMVIHCGGTRVKYEIFRADQFSERAKSVDFVHAQELDKLLTPLDIETGDFVRVRQDGKWLPQGYRALYPTAAALRLISQHTLQLMQMEDAE